MIFQESIFLKNFMKAHTILDKVILVEEEKKKKTSPNKTVCSCLWPGTPGQILSARDARCFKNIWLVLNKAEKVFKIKVHQI